MTARFFISFTLIAILALTQVGCAKRTASKREIFQAGIGYCSGRNLGEFDVLLSRSVENPGYFELKIVTVSVVRLGGEYVQAGLANKRLDNEVLVPAMLLKQNQVLYEGFLSTDQLDLYDLIVIAPYKGGQTTLLGTSSDGTEAICEIPTRDTTT